MKIMKRMKQMMSLAAAILALSGCSSEDDILSAFHNDPDAVHITAEVGKASADGFTRSNPLGTPDEQKKFNNGDMISVKADGQEAVIYKLDGSEWVPQGGKFLKWENETMKFTAYYPASYTGGTPTQTLEYNDEASLIAADYMSFTDDVKNPGDNSLTLTMNRQMARVVVEIVGFNNQYASGTEVNSVTINGTVKAFKQEKQDNQNDKFYALMVPCSAQNDKEFLSLEVGTGNTKETLKGIPALEAGKSYTFQLTVGKNKVVVSGITVANWTTGEIINGKTGSYPYVTFTATGEQIFKMKTAGSYTIAGLQYSVNEGEWKKVVANEDVPFGGDKGNLRLRGTNNPNGTSTGFNESTNNLDYSYIQFGTNAEVACTGDIRTLLDYKTYKTVDTSNARFCFLFRNCVALTSAPDLPATTLAEFCYYSMFYDCSSLKVAPALPATTLAARCYENMFFCCSNLQEAPELPATNLTNSCYYSMFERCSSLKKAPALPAQTLESVCYTSMFNGCTNLSSVTMLAPSNQILGDRFTKWLLNAGTGATSRTLIVKDEDAYDALVSKGYLPADYWQIGKCTILDETGLDLETPYLTFTANAAQTFKMAITGSYAISGLQYSVNHGTWTDVEANKGVTFGGDKGNLRLRGTNQYGTAPAWDKYSTITFTEPSVKVACTGDIRTLLDWRNYENVATDQASFCNLFLNCEALTSAPKLPATILAETCYQNMFQKCTSLTSAPALPATNLANYCYSYMFSGCTSLTSAPELPATTLKAECYSYMFSGCTSLESAPKMSAERLAQDCCEHMFRNCTSLTSAPELSATELAYGCYAGMFQKCTSLTSAPKLPATKLEDQCYVYMFAGCSNLSTVTMLALGSEITSNSARVEGWLYKAGTETTSRTLKIQDKAAYEALKANINYLPAQWQKDTAGTTVQNASGNAIE